MQERVPSERREGALKAVVVFEMRTWMPEDAVKETVASLVRVVSCPCRIRVRELLHSSGQGQSDFTEGPTHKQV